MDGSVKLGRVRGIEIGVHPTWLIVFGLLAYSLAAGVFPARYEGWAPAEYWGVGALAALLLFASVLAHELGHAVIAQARGVGVRSITLFVFGGVAQLEEESETPGDEFWIAIAGPVVSVAIAAASAGLWQASQGVSEQVAATFAYLASANLILVLFNLIPGYPLDGGRVLRAIVWRVSGNVRTATKVAATAGMVVAYLFVAGGVFLAFQALVSGIWLVAIGWFLQNAAQLSYRQVTLERSLAGVRARALMDPQPVVVAPNATVDELVRQYVLGRNVRGLPVVDDRSLVGIVTLSDVKDIPPEEWGRFTVGDRMTPRERLVVAEPETALWEALRAMADRDVHQVPVVRGDQLVGLLTRGAVLRYLHLRQELPDEIGEPAAPPGDRRDRRRGRRMPGGRGGVPWSVGRADEHAWVG